MKEETEERPQGLVDRAVESWLSSSEGLDKAVDEPVELRVVLAELGDLADGMDDGRVVLSSKVLPDLG
jgi:hypothetical protein